MLINILRPTFVGGVSTFPNPELYMKLVNDLYLTNGNGTATFSRSSTGLVYAYDSTDTLRWVEIEANVPRFQGMKYLGNGTWSDTLSNGTTLAASGLVIDGPVTNLCVASRDVTVVAWYKPTGITAARNAIGIDGVSNGASTITESATGTGYAAAVTPGIPSGSVVNYCGSIFFKKTSGSTTLPGIYMKALNGGTDISAGRVVDTNEGKLYVTSSSSYGSPATTSIQDYGDFWRVSLAITTNTGNTQLHLGVWPAISYASNPGSLSANATGSCIVDCVQIERDRIYPSSPVTTSGVSASGYDEFITVPGSNWSQDLFTLDVTLTPISEDDFGSDGSIIRIGTDNTGCALTAAAEPDTIYVDRSGNGGLSNRVSVSTNMASGVDKNITWVMDGANSKVYENHALVVSTPLTNTPVDTITGDIIIGKGFYGRLKELKIYNRGFSDTQVSQIP